MNVNIPVVLKDNESGWRGIVQLENNSISEMKPM